MRHPPSFLDKIMRSSLTTYLAAPHSETSTIIPWQNSEIFTNYLISYAHVYFQSYQCHCHPFGHQNLAKARATRHDAARSPKPKRQKVPLKHKRLTPKTLLGRIHIKRKNTPRNGFQYLIKAVKTNKVKCKCPFHHWLWNWLPPTLTFQSQSQKKIHIH